MKRLMMATALISLMLTSSAYAASLNIKPWVSAKIDSMTRAKYTDKAEYQVYKFGFFRERGNATQSIPFTEVERARPLVASIRPDQDGIWHGASSPMRVDTVYTQNSRTLNIIWNESFQSGRAWYMNDMTGRNCAIGQGIANDDPCAYLVIVTRPPGMPSQVPGRFVGNFVTHDEFNHANQGLRQDLDKLRADVEALKNDRRNGAIMPSDIGLYAFGGMASFMIDQEHFNGPFVGIGIRYYDFDIEVVTGEKFTDSNEQVQFTKQDVFAKFGNNNFQGGGFYWAPAQRAQVTYTWRDEHGRKHKEATVGRRYGWRYKIGAFGAHLQRDNILNQSDLDAYFAGASGSVALPMSIVTPRLWGCIGYGRTITSSHAYGQNATISDGLSGGLYVALEVGKR